MLSIKLCADGTELSYAKLCICSGVRPKLLLEGHPAVVGLRDSQSAEDLCRRLGTARRVVVVGNGGIALELVHEVRGNPGVYPPYSYYPAVLS